MARRFLMFGAAIGLVASACTSAVTPETTTSTTEVVTTTLAPASPVASDGFGVFVGQAAASLLLLEPQMVTDIGARDILGSTDSSLDDLSPSTQSARVALARSVLASLETVDTADLSPDERITAEILRWQLEDIIALDEFEPVIDELNVIVPAVVTLNPRSIAARTSNSAENLLSS